MSNEDDDDEMATTKARLRDRIKKSPNFTTIKIQEFVQNCRANFHIFYHITPNGAKFKRNLLDHPALLSCCTVIWSVGLSKDGFVSLGNLFLSQSELSNTEKRRIVQACIHMYQETVTLSKKFYLETSQILYITPVHYVDILKNFARLLVTRRE